MKPTCSIVLAAPIMFAPILACFCVVSAVLHTAAVAIPSVGMISINPATGNDAQCGASSTIRTSCKTIARAVELNVASILYLEPGIYSEPTIYIRNHSSLVITGAPNATVFDCSRRLVPTGAAFSITDSVVTINGVTFQSCVNVNSTGGAVVSSGSSLVVSHCSFINCSAASGGAMSVSGPGSGLFLYVRNSSFSGNSARGGLIGCPQNAALPCSTWGGAIAAFDMFNVTISGCSMVSNSARAFVPSTSGQYSKSRNAVAGGGCISVLFSGNASGCSVIVSGNSFQLCAVDISGVENIIVGNGYGGAFSVYFGLDAGIQQLFVSLVNIELRSNVFTRCAVSSSPVLGGNVYGGAISIYMGGYSSVYSRDGPALAAAGDTMIRNVSILLHTAQFTSCSASISTSSSQGANAYGGSFSFYIGAYAWSFTSYNSAKGNSTCGATIASALLVSVTDAPCSNCSAVTSSDFESSGANTYGGSMSVVYVGAYAWSSSYSASSNSACGSTSARDFSVSVSAAPCFNCSAVTSSDFQSSGANTYGGSMSVVYVGAYAWSLSQSASSSSSCGSTSARDLNIGVSASPCSNCIATSKMNSGFGSFGANAFGGSMSVLYVGAYAWSRSDMAISGSTCGETSASGLVVNIFNASCSNCSAAIFSGSQSRGTGSYGGSMSVVYVGAYASSFSASASSSSACGSTIANDLSIGVSNTSCSNCRSASATSIGLGFLGVNSYGGLMNVLYIGAHSWSFTTDGISSSSCLLTNSSGLSVSIVNAFCSNCSATTSSNSVSFGANSYGGSMSVVYVGAKALSYSSILMSNSSCGTTSLGGLNASISNVYCFNCSALTIAGSIHGANSYGGSMSVVYIGAYAWSLGNSVISSSICGNTSASSLSVIISNVSCSSCSATIRSRSFSQGGNSYGGSVSVVHVGAHSWSSSFTGISNSTCGISRASGVNVSVGYASCSVCSAVTASGSHSSGANSYGGSMSVVFLGARSWSRSDANISWSTCLMTNSSHLSVVVENVSCVHCRTEASSRDVSSGANSYGGSLNVLLLGSYSWSFSRGGFLLSSTSISDSTQTEALVIVISNSSFCDSHSIGYFASSSGSDALGGSISAFIGAYVWSMIGFGSSMASSSETRCSNCTFNLLGLSIMNSSAQSSISGGGLSSGFAYGGGVSIYFGSYVWSTSSFNGESTCSAGATNVLGLSAVFENCSFSSSSALTSAVQGSNSASRVSSYGSNAIGGAIALLAGAHVVNFGGLDVSPLSIAGVSAVDNSRFAMTDVTFSNCSAISLTVGSGSSSFGSSSVYGGAIAVVHSAQVSEFASGLLSPPQALFVSGDGFAVSILNSTFMNCAVLTNSASTRPGLANGGGGAVYVNSIALSKLKVRDCVFNSNSVIVACGATGAASNSSGGALAVAPGSLRSVVEVTSCSFINCTARGASIANLAVRGGAVAVFGVAHVSVTGSTFINCNINNTYASSSSIDELAVSGGAGISAAISQSVIIDRCLFDAANGQDASETSTGLLVLASNETRSHVVITQTSMKSSSLALNVRCVSNDASTPEPCPQSGPSVTLTCTNSIFLQYISPVKDDFNGSSLISLQKGASSSFIDSRLRCANGLDFAAFKKNSVNPPSTIFSCGPCAPFSISLSASEVLLEQLVKEPLADRCRVVSADNKCPFGVEACSTFVSVVRGFWANFSSLTPNNLTKVIRCPHGYCNCSSTTAACTLTPLLSINRRPDPLCSGKRIGYLCGGCPLNHTQSMNDKSCVSNELCKENLWWLWTLSILGYAAYSLYIVLSSRKLDDGAFSCLLFFFQVSSFAASPDESDGSLAVLEFAQVRSLLSLYEGACFAPSMTAYGATAAKLSGPLLVLAFTAGWTHIMQVLRPRLLQRNIDVSVSFGGTLAAAGLFVFSGVSKVVFTLVECSNYDSDGVIFIDGTVPCKDVRWTVLIVVAALLCLCPLLFARALHRKAFPQSTRDAVCGKFVESVFYWGAVTLAFRLLMSLMQFLGVNTPNIMACTRVALSVGMFLLLVYLRPYAHVSTFWVDVACYVCLIAQFSLQTIDADRQYFGVAESSGQKRFLSSVSTSSTIIRFLPVAVYAIIRLHNTKAYETLNQTGGLTHRTMIHVNKFVRSMLLKVKAQRRMRGGRAQQTAGSENSQDSHNDDVSTSQSGSVPSCSHSSS